MSTQQPFQDSQAIRQFPTVRTDERRWGPDRIKALRKHLGLTQKDAGPRIGMARTTWGRWESGFWPGYDAETKLDKLAAESGFDENPS